MDAYDLKPPPLFRPVRIAWSQQFNFWAQTNHFVFKYATKLNFQSAQLLTWFSHIVRERHPSSDQEVDSLLSAHIAKEVFKKLNGHALNGIIMLNSIVKPVFVALASTRANADDGDDTVEPSYCLYRWDEFNTYLAHALENVDSMFYYGLGEENYREVVVPVPSGIKSSSKRCTNVTTLASLSSLGLIMLIVLFASSELDFEGSSSGNALLGSLICILTILTGYSAYHVNYQLKLTSHLPTQLGLHDESKVFEDSIVESETEYRNMPVCPQQLSLLFTFFFIPLNFVFIMGIIEAIDPPREGDSSGIAMSAFAGVCLFFITILLYHVLKQIRPDLPPRHLMADKHIRVSRLRFIEYMKHKLKSVQSRVNTVIHLSNTHKSYLEQVEDYELGQTADRNIWSIIYETWHDMSPLKEFRFESFNKQPGFSFVFKGQKLEGGFCLSRGFKNLVSDYIHRNHYFNKTVRYGDASVRLLQIVSKVLTGGYSDATLGLGLRVIRVKARKSRQFHELQGFKDAALDMTSEANRYVLHLLVSIGQALIAHHALPLDDKLLQQHENIMEMSYRALEVATQLYTDILTQRIIDTLLLTEESSSKATESIEGDDEPSDTQTKKIMTVLLDPTSYDALMSHVITSYNELKVEKRLSDTPSVRLHSALTNGADSLSRFLNLEDNRVPLKHSKETASLISFSANLMGLATASSMEQAEHYASNLGLPSHRHLDDRAYEVMESSESSAGKQWLVKSLNSFPTYMSRVILEQLDTLRNMIGNNNICIQEFVSFFSDSDKLRQCVSGNMSRADSEALNLDSVAVDQEQVPGISEMYAGSEGIIQSQEGALVDSKEEGFHAVDEVEGSTPLYKSIERYSQILNRDDHVAIAKIADFKGFMGELQNKKVCAAFLTDVVERSLERKYYEHTDTRMKRIRYGLSSSSAAVGPAAAGPWNPA